MNNWRETKIWQRIQEVDKGSLAKVIRSVLELWMPEIEDVLKSGGTSPTDFTLHDDQHSFRVAKRMPEIIPQKVFNKLSIYELSLLLLSAYLHDIGMTPKQAKVKAHRDYLLTGATKGEFILTKAEQKNLQKWLDDNWDGLVPPLGEELSVEQRYNLVDHVVTHYARHCHNDWSAEWINHNVPSKELYPNWLDDLIDLCKSHHFGKKELEKTRFDGRIVDSEGGFVNLRYLAAILRIADVMENDPERTPDVIFQHRNIDESSHIYWYKDHNFTLHVDRGKNGITCSATAQPRNARLHKAVEETLDLIDHELMTCFAFASENYFSRCKAMAQPPHAYEWSLANHVLRSVEPFKDSYEYIDGAFRPDTHKLLELLSGVELYGDPLIAVRELLQNSFDAVKESIAIERLELANPNDEREVEMIRKRHKVDLRLETKGDSVWLVCTDNGVGMSKDIITRHLLVSGKAKRHEILDLERRCQAKGFSIERTGQFGIGVLSYFMLADCVQIRTRRVTRAGGVDANGWFFESYGVGSFGELRREQVLHEGTEVRLRLKREFVNKGLEAWYNKFVEYLEATLVKIPSRFGVNTDFSKKAILEKEPGWFKTIKDFTEEIVPRIMTLHDDLHGRSSNKIISREIELENFRSRLATEITANQLKESVKWFVLEGKLPNLSGNYRCAIPYFELPGGISLAYHEVFSIPKNHKGAIFYMSSRSYMLYEPMILAWKGMNLTVSSSSDKKNARLQSRAFVTIDIHKEQAEKLAINRNSLVGDIIPAIDTMSYVRDQIDKQARLLIEKHKKSIYSWMNFRVFGFEPSLDTKLIWPKYEKVNSGFRSLLSYIKPPIVFYSRYSSREDLFYQNRLVTELPDLQVESIPEMGQTIHSTMLHGWYSTDISPDKLVVVGNNRLGFIWSKLQVPKSWELAWMVKFPKSWSGIWFISKSGLRVSEHDELDDDVILNRDHFLTPFLRLKDWQAITKNKKLQTNPIKNKDWILSTKHHASAWLFHSIVQNNNVFWEGLVDKYPDFLDQVWRLLLGNKVSKKYQGVSYIYWDDAIQKTYTLNTYTTSTVTKRDIPRNSFDVILGDPGTDFIIRKKRSAS